MKDVIDLMAVQQLKDSMNRTPCRDYRLLSTMSPKQPPDLAARFLFECSIKLHMKPLTSALAAVFLHRFYREVDKCEYDEFLIASCCLYLAGKVKDDPVKIRDVINVSHCTLNRTVTPLDLGDEYWAIRDGLVQAELFITRMLNFNLTTVHPHKYLLHYMKSLQNWLGTAVWNSAPIAKTAAAFLQDFHHSPEILDHKPQHLAVCCLSLALQIYGVQVPETPDLMDLDGQWYNVFAEHLTKETHWEICQKIMSIYSVDANTTHETEGALATHTD